VKNTGKLKSRFAFACKFTRSVTPFRRFSYLLLNFKYTCIKLFLSSRGSVLGRRRDFIFSPPCPDRLWGPLNLLSGSKAAAVKHS